jgi:molybdenum cofactor biosynthesis enzyme MoaA
MSTHAALKASRYPARDLHRLRVQPTIPCYGQCRYCMPAVLNANTGRQLTVYSRCWILAHEVLI